MLPSFYVMTNKQVRVDWFTTLYFKSVNCHVREAEFKTGRILTAKQLLPKHSIQSNVFRFSIGKNVS